MPTSRNPHFKLHIKQPSNKITRIQSTPTLPSFIDSSHPCIISHLNYKIIIRGDFNNSSQPSNRLIRNSKHKTAIHQNKSLNVYADDILLYLQNPHVSLYKT